MLKKLEEYPCNPPTRNIILDFLKDTLGVSDHLEVIETKEANYDQEGSKIEIPNLPGELRDVNYNKIRNSFNYMTVFYEEMRILTKEVFGLTPGSESLIFVHGVFKKAEMEKYCQRNAADVSGFALQVPVGEPVVVDLFREVLSNTVFRAKDPEYNTLFDSRKHNFESKVNKFSQRVKSGQALVDKDTKELISQYKHTLKGLDSVDINKLEKDAYNEWFQTRQKIMAKLNEVLESVTEEKENIVEITVDGEIEYAKINEEELEEIKKESNFA